MDKTKFLSRQTKLSAQTNSLPEQTNQVPEQTSEVGQIICPLAVLGDSVGQLRDWILEGIPAFVSFR